MCDQSPVPLKYLDSLELRQHIVLFYEESEYARLIEFRFLRNGLDSGEQCVYATDADSGSIVLKMLTYGIPLRYFQTGRLKVYQIQRTCGNRDEIMKNCKNDIGMILSSLIPPFRIVSRIVQDVSTTDGMEVELELEHAVHEKFDDFGGSLICPYDISKIESSKRGRWLEKLRENHHAVIYAPKFGEGGVFVPCDPIHETCPRV
jgi:hypothetical protein